MKHLVVIAIMAASVTACMELPDFGSEAAALETSGAYVSGVTGADPASITQRVRITEGRAYVSTVDTNGYQRCELVLRRTRPDIKAAWQVVHATCGYAT